MPQAPLPFVPVANVPRLLPAESNFLMASVAALETYRFPEMSKRSPIGLFKPLAKRPWSAPVEELYLRTLLLPLMAT